jgi:large subunit ribosomal protein L13
MTTYSAKPSEIKKIWYVIDATDVVLGRLASKVATILRGKHKPTFTTSLDCDISRTLNKTEYNRKIEICF